MLRRIVIATPVADHHGHGNFELAARHVMGLGGEVENSVEADADEIDKSDFNDRTHTRHGRAGGDTDEAGLRDRGVDHAMGAALLRHDASAPRARHREGACRAAGAGCLLCHVMNLYAKTRSSASLGAGYSLS